MQKRSNFIIISCFNCPIDVDDPPELRWRSRRNCAPGTGSGAGSCESREIQISSLVNNVLIRICIQLQYSLEEGSILELVRTGNTALTTGLYLGTGATTSFHTYQTTDGTPSARGSYPMKNEIQ